MNFSHRICFHTKEAASENTWQHCTRSPFIFLPAFPLPTADALPLLLGATPLTSNKRAKVQQT